MKALVARDGLDATSGTRTMASVSDDPAVQHLRLIRALRQRLESLRRAGLDRIEAPLIPEVIRRSPTLARVRPAEIAPESAEEEALVRAEPPPARLAPEVPAARTLIMPDLPKPPPVASLFGDSEFDSPPLPPAERTAELAALAAEVATCKRCPILVANRTQTVFGVGSPKARLMFVGEAPGVDEDRLGEPFVGRAGLLLNDMITKGMGLQRQHVYIANVIKSRPPDNRNPEADEIANCLPYLERQIAIIRPEFLCLLGKVAASALLDTALSIARLRGRWHRYRGIPAIVTYHPAYLLRNPASKREAWEDLQILMNAMGLTPPGRQRSGA
jgi:DNA polymerase